MIRVGKEEEKWSEITSKELQEMIAEAVPIIYEELKEKGMGMGKLVEVLTTLEGKRDEEEVGEEKMGEGEKGEGVVDKGEVGKGEVGEGEVGEGEKGEGVVGEGEVGKGEVGEGEVGEGEVGEGEVGEGEVGEGEVGEGEVGEGEKGEGVVGKGEVGEGEVGEGEVGEGVVGEKNQQEGLDSGSAASESESAGGGKAAIDTVIQKLTRLICDGKSSKCLLDMQWIYFTDCGGQQAFWDLIPIFTYDTSATIFVHHLCEKLDERPLNDLYKSGQRVGPSQRATLTTAETFKTMLRGLQEKCKRSKIVAVGTHKDLGNECEETPEAKNKKFATIISPHYKKYVLYCGEDMKDVISQVNTIDPKVDDQKTAGKIRAGIEKCATDTKYRSGGSSWSSFWKR